MGKSINIEKKYTTRKTQNKKKKKFGGMSSLDMINLGINVFREISNFTNTIVEQRNKTEEARIETDRIKVESNERLKALELGLQKDVLNMNKELEIYREDIKVKLKNIDKEIEENKVNYETMQLRLKLDHEVKLKLINEQGRILDRVLDIYSKYYDAILRGNQVAISPDFIFKDMQNCIDVLKHSISTMSGENKIIDTEFSEE